MISLWRRLARGLTTVAAVLLPLLVFLLSVVALHDPAVIGIVLVRTPEGIWQLSLLFLTAVLPALTAWLAGQSSLAPVSNRFFSVTLAGAVTMIYAAEILLLSFRLVTGIALDLSIIWFHFGDSLRTLGVLVGEHGALLSGGLLLLMLNFRGLLRGAPPGAAAATANGGARRSTALFAAFLALTIVSQGTAENGLVNLVMEPHQPTSAARAIYVKYFDDSVRRSQIHTTATAQPSDPQNIFVVQLESINALLVNREVTPQLLRIVESHGVLLPRIQASTVFTVLSMETILCGTLPTLGRNLAAISSLHAKLHCLPRLLKEKGYKTLYFQAYPDLQFNNMGPFFRAIGFDETHAGDIMQPGDPKLKWGYAEEVFYRRVFEYLAKRQGEKLFVYILAGSTNHYPFYDGEMAKFYPPAEHRLPYRMPANMREQMANTMFLQDRFFGAMYENQFKPRFAANSDLFVLGDHSWPIEVHAGARHNLAGAYQENFVTTMAYLPRTTPFDGQDRAVGRVVDRLYSHLDLLPTIAELYGIRPSPYYGRSFAAELAGNLKSPPGERRCLVSVQPFAGGSIAIISYPLKHLFDLKTNQVSVYDLGGDQDETRPLETRAIDQEMLGVLEKCLRANAPAEPSEKANN